MPRLFLFDGMSIVFRAFHAMSKTPLQSPAGELTGAVFGFANIIATILTKEKPDYVAVCFDTSAPTFRHIKYEQYKAHRPEFPQELVSQLHRIKEMLTLLRIKQIELPGYEADDIIGTLARSAAEQGMQVLCVTNDKDYCQLVNDHINIFKPGFAMGEYDIIDRTKVIEKFGVPPEQVIDVLALMGDSSDNVPGVPGIGEKTAAPLVRAFGSVEGIYQNIASVEKEAHRKKLEAGKDLAFLSKELVTIDCNVPIERGIEQFAIMRPDVQEVSTFFQTLGFRSMLAKFSSLFGSMSHESASIPNNASEQISAPSESDHTASTDTAPPLRRLHDIPHTYHFCHTQELALSALEHVRDVLRRQQSESKEPLFCFDSETTELSQMKAEIVGVSFAVEESIAYYIPHDVLFDKTISAPTLMYAPQQDLFESKESSVQHTVPQTVSQADARSTEEYRHNGQQDMFAPVQDDSRTAMPPSPPAHQVIPEAHEPFVSFTPSAVFLLLQDLLQDASIPKCGQNLKYDALVLRKYGIVIHPISFDTMLASYVLDSSSAHNMDALAKKWLQYEPISITTLIGEKKKDQISMREVEPARVAEYAAEDADITLRLAHTLHTELIAHDPGMIAKQLEFPVSEVLTAMEFHGVRINTAALQSLSTMIEEQTTLLRAEIFRETDAEFNLDSPKQLGEVLFDKLKIPPVKKTKTGYSTDQSVLEELALTHPVAHRIVEYRQLQKLQSTYVEALPRLIHPRTGRIHTTYNQTITSTGRLSSTDPNLQNIPVRTALGMEIRKAFIADTRKHPDMLLLSADYSQIELRIMAHICKDETLTHAFLHNIDVHAATASTLFGVDIHAVDRDQRRIAKTVNFGVMYGQGSFGLAQQLKISRNEAKAIIDDYFAKYPRIKEYIDSTIRSAREHGYVESLLGRRRHYPDINSNNRQIRTATERAAINMPIQATAADMMKLAMIAVHNRIKERRLQSVMLLQIHDELVFEMHPDERTILPDIVKSCMESAYSLGDIPVVVDIGTGTNWAEAH